MTNTTASRRDLAISRACKTYEDKTEFPYSKQALREAIDAYEAAMREPPTPEERLGALFEEFARRIGQAIRDAIEDDRRERDGHV